VIHRDLKPANMMLTPEGRIKLLDFGIAKLAADRSLTRTGFLVGSLPYISPEQVEGLADIDTRTDIYSLGVTLYQALTGQAPFLADSEYSLMRKHLQETPVPPMEVMSDVPPALNDIVMRALEKDRARRFQTAAEMAAALRAVNLGGAAAPTLPLATAPPPPPPGQAAMPMPMPMPIPAPAVPEARKFSNRGLYIALGSVVTVVVLVVGATQLPKFLGTEAAAPQAPAVEQPKEAPPPAAEEPKAEQPPAVEAPKPEQPSTTAAESKPAQAQARPQRQTPALQAPPVVQQQPPAQAAQPPAQVAQPPVQIAQPAVQAAPDNSKALAELREQLMLLGTRVSAAQASLNRLKQEQARQGLGLRGDIAALAQRVEFYMDEAEAAIKRGDDAAGKKYLDQAGRETARLESFLGR
jgi:serine/threonine-protein kinase